MEDSFIFEDIHILKSKYLLSLIKLSLINNILHSKYTSFFAYVGITDLVAIVLIFPDANNLSQVEIQVVEYAHSEIMMNI